MEEQDISSLVYGNILLAKSKKKRRLMFKPWGIDACFIQDVRDLGDSYSVTARSNKISYDTRSLSDLIAPPVEKIEVHAHERKLQEAARKLAWLSPLNKKEETIDKKEEEQKISEPHIQKPITPVISVIKDGKYYKEERPHYIQKKKVNGEEVIYKWCRHKLKELRKDVEQDKEQKNISFNSGRYEVLNDLYEFLSENFKESIMVSNLERMINGEK